MEERQSMTRRRFLTAVSALPLFTGCLAISQEDFHLHLINHSEEQFDSVQIQVTREDDEVFSQKFSLAPGSGQEISDVFPPSEYTLRVSGEKIVYPTEQIISPNGCSTPEVYITISDSPTVSIDEKEC